MSPDLISTDLSDWESEDDVSEREELVKRLRGVVGFIESLADNPEYDADALARDAGDVLAAIRLLEAAPREPDGWVDAHWRLHLPVGVISLYRDKVRDDEVPVYIGAPKPEVEP